MFDYLAGSLPIHEAAGWLGVSPDAVAAIAARSTVDYQACRHRAAMELRELADGVGCLAG